MTKEITAATFDYSALDKDVKGKLISLAGQVKREKQKHAASGMSIGESVALAHSLLAVNGKDGRFSEWVESECGFSRTTAYRYMWTWQRFGNCSSLEQFTVEALEQLASPNAPEMAVKEAVKLADKGVRVNKDKAKEILDRFRDVADKPRSSGRTSAPRKLPSQSDAPPEPAPDEPEKAVDQNTPSIAASPSQQTTSQSSDSKPKISGGTTFNVAELTGESKDAFDKEPPDDLRQVFELREGFEEQRNKLAAVQTWITQNENHPGAKHLQGAASRIRSDLKQASSEFKFCMPHCVCVYCKNKAPKRDNCNACKGLGWITEPIFNQAPEALKRESKRSA